jgi:hypothetical protein
MLSASEIKAILDGFISSLEMLRQFRRNPADFTRNRKLTFQNLMWFILQNSRASAQIALDRFFYKLGEAASMTKQSCFEAREKLKPEAFLALGEQLMSGMNAKGGFRTYRGLRIIGGDGSVFEVPASAAKEFGALKTKGNPVAKARAMAFVDVLNDLVLSASLEEYSSSERNMALDLLGRAALPKDAVYVFDRGFYSYALAQAVEKLGAKFLFRVKSNCQKDMMAANAPDQTIQVNDMTMRVVNFVLPGGEVERLVTNLLDPSFTVADFGVIYNKRWGVETSFLMLKERLQIENFSSGKRQLILQDFYASIVTYNITVLACAEGKARLEKEAEAAGRTLAYKPNMNIAISAVRDYLIEALCGEKSRRKRALLFFFSAIRKNASPIRPDRSSPRNAKNHSAKFPLNKKSNA